MSGIAVVYEMDGRPADAALLERMLSAIAHRGPDGIGRFVKGPVALGHSFARKGGDLFLFRGSILR